MRFARALSTLIPGLVVAGLVALAPNARARPEKGAGAAASEHPLVTRAAMEILDRGGSAADAAVAAALVAGVVTPSSCGLGGGGFAMVFSPADSATRFLDFREVAPSGVERAALERRPLPFPERGHLIGVPGEPRGLFELSRRFGKLPFRELTRSAEKHARAGYAIGPHLNRMLGFGPVQADLKQDPGLAKLFFSGKAGAPLLGRTVRNPGLARTLARLGAEGPNAIYDGAIAAEIVRGARGVGSSLSAEDLQRYAPREREPLRVSWAGYDVYTAPPPSAGGLLLAETLGMLDVETVRRLRPQSPAYQHLLAEAFRRSFIDRFRLVGDPDFVPLDVNALLKPERLARLRKSIALDRTHSLPQIAQEEHGTHHLVFADRSGMVVSLTTTVNRLFGAKISLPDSGIVLNDQLDDFTLARDAAALGIAESPNAPRPGARPVSSMTPTLVFQAGRPVFAIGGAGGMTISPNVTQLLIGRLAFEQTPEELVKVPRFQIPLRGANTINVDPATTPADLDELARRGERVGKIDFDISSVQILGKVGDAWQAAADPRKSGSAEVH